MIDMKIADIETKEMPNYKNALFCLLLSLSGSAAGRFLVCDSLFGCLILF